MKKNRYTALIKSTIFILISILSLGLQAQDIRFYAQTDAKEIFENSYLDVEFVLTNAEGVNFQPPKFKNFEIIAGPNKASEISIVNGRRSSKKKYSYTLLAKKIGKQTIAPATILINNKKYKSNSITITVKKNSNTKSVDDSRKYFIKTEISDTTAYPGQEIVLKYILFTSIDVSNYNFRKIPDFDGFIAREFKDSDQQERVIINDKEYLKVTLKSIALFPQKTGVIKIPLANIVISIPDNRSRNSFFRSTRSFNVQGEGVNITVEPLPTKPNDTFSNNVGKFSIKSQIKVKKITTDDAFPLYIQLDGTGSAKFIEAPDISKNMENFEIYDPKVVNQKEYVKDNMLYGRKIFEYLIVPKKTGEFNINIDYTYFDTDSAKYITLSTRPGKIKVFKGKNSGKVDIDKVLAKYKLSPPIENISISKKNKPFFGSFLYWLLISIALLFIPALYFYRQYLIKQGNISPDIVRRNKSTKEALKRLKAAKDYMITDNKKEFYKELEDALLKFVADKLNIPKIDLNKDNLKNKLETSGVSNELSNDYIDLLKSCEIALYGGNPNDKLDSKLKKATQLITELDLII